MLQVLFNPRFEGFPNSPQKELDVVQYSGSRHQMSESDDKQVKMPVDYASYLLSASPPGFDYHYNIRFSGHHFGAETKSDELEDEMPSGPSKPSFSKFRYRSRARRIGRTSLYDGSDLSSETPVLGVETESETDKEIECESSLHVDENGVTNGHEDEDSDTEPGDSEDVVCNGLFDLQLEETETHSICIKDNGKQSRSVRTKKTVKKKVSFADDKGLSLTKIRLMTDSSDTPPCLHPQVLSSLTQGATAGVSETPPLVLNFSQPASDYIAFRKKIEHNCVSLENVILRDYNLMGTVKVKNLDYHKVVTVVCTFDNWKSTEEIEATYMHNQGCEDGPHAFDTFSFEINVPPSLDVKQRVQFCIRYDVLNQQFWDNNDGANYEVATRDWESNGGSSLQEDNVAMSTSPSVQDSNWGSYTFWGKNGRDEPYY